MNDVICPSCHSVTPPWLNCLVCNASLERWLEKVIKTAASATIKPSRSSAKAENQACLQYDARLRRICGLREKQGIVKLPTASTSEDEITVIAKVKDLAAFEAFGQVKIVTTIAATADDPTTLVTARILAVKEIVERLRQEPYVVSLKAAQRIRPFLERTIEETCAGNGMLLADQEKERKEGEKKKRGGRGVIVGIVDFGFDFAHRNFLQANGKGGTRILALWDQTAEADPNHSPQPFGYGRLFTKAEIDAALKRTKPYEALGYEPQDDSIFDTGAHGTYVADVAVGSGVGSGCPGVAPEADIVFVDVSTAGTPLQGPQALSSTFGDSAQLLEAIKFIFDFAGDQPCVINLSLGTNGGPHDGTTLVEEAMDRLVSEKPNRAVVIAAGNAFDEDLHVTGQVPDGGTVDLRWRIPPFDSTSNEMELWYSGEDQFSLDVLDPDGIFLLRVSPGETKDWGSSGQGLLTVVNRLKDPNNGDNTINVFFERGLRDGVWTLRLYGKAVRDGCFQAWIERDELGQSRFIEAKDSSYQISPHGTLASIACGRQTIVVGSYDAHKTGTPLAESSSAGPTRDGRHKPEVSAPGEQVLAAQSGTIVLRRRQSGTSMAAPAVTGVVALVLAEAKVKGISLTTDQIRRIVMLAARKAPPTGERWHERFGYGRICAARAVALVSALTNNCQPSGVTKQAIVALGRADQDQIQRSNGNNRGENRPISRETKVGRQRKKQSAKSGSS